MIRFYKPTIKRKDMDSVLQTLVEEEIGTGSRTQSLIEMFCEITSAYSGFAYRSYEQALINGLKILGAEKGTRIALSPLSPCVYLKVITKLECEAVYVDVDKENGCPDSNLVNNSACPILMLYEPDSSLPVKYDSETTYCKKINYGNVKILEDVSTSLTGYILDEVKAGEFGDAVVCAMEEDNLVSAAGGAVLAVSSEYSDKLEEIKPDTYSSMTDLNASLAKVQLLNLEENSQKRRNLYKNYQQSLSRTEHKQFGLLVLDYISPCFSFSVTLNSKPDEAVAFAKKHDIPLKRTFENSVCSLYEGDMFDAFPASAAYYYRTFSLPIYPFLKDSEADMINKVIAHLP